MSFPWYDFQPSPTVDNGIPDHVRFLRIGFLEYQRLLRGKAAARLMEVPNFACSEHPNLRRVQIYLPGVSNIGAYAFAQCKRLEHVEFRMKQPREELEDEEVNPPPSQLVSIRICAFQDCFNLSYITGLEYAAESLKEIRFEAFLGCKSLANVGFLARLITLRSLGCSAFSSNRNVTTISLSKAVYLTELEDLTFYGCTALVTIHLPPNLHKIGDRAFAECVVLEQIHLPPGLHRVGIHAFKNCCNLKSIVWPSSLQQIGRQCFWDCKKLISVVLLSSRVKFLTMRPFDRNCTALSSLELPHPVPRQQWPLILEQFSKEDGIAKSKGSICNTKNRNTIMWNFLRRNLAQFFMGNNAATMSRRRQAPPL